MEKCYEQSITSMGEDVAEKTKQKETSNKKYALWMMKPPLLM